MNRGKNIFSPDYIFLINLLALLGMGIIMILSASPIVALKNFQDPFYFIKRHLLSIGMGLGALGLGAWLPIQYYRRHLVFLLGGTVFLLLLTYMPGIGVKAGGASRWIQIFSFSFQPSELAKLIAIFFAAQALSNKRQVITNFWRGVFPILAFVGLLVLLILKQPDLGTSLVIFATIVIMSYLTGARTWQLLIFLLISARVLLWMIMRTPYQKTRFLAFLNPWEDPLGYGFQVIQSILAVGSGGILGVGLGQSRQKFDFLPQQFTDFIFAIICEEGGLLVATFVLILFIIFLFRGLRIAMLLKDPYEQLLAGGITAWIVIQALLNMMVVLGMAPTTGITLPFISYGGTSLLITLWACGILIQLSRNIPN